MIGSRLGPTHRGQCTQIVYTLAPKYLCRDHLSRPTYILFWVHEMGVSENRGP